MTWALLGSRVWGFVRQIPGWVWIVIAVALTWRVSLIQARAEERKTASANSRAKQAEDTVRVVEKIKENTDAAIEQADSVRARGPDVVELPDGYARLPEHHYRDRADGGES